MCLSPIKNIQILIYFDQFWLRPKSSSNCKHFFSFLSESLRNLFIGLTILEYSLEQKSLRSPPLSSKVSGTFAGCLASRYHWILKVHEQSLVDEKKNVYNENFEVMNVTEKEERWITQTESHTCTKPAWTVMWTNEGWSTHARERRYRGEIVQECMSISRGHLMTSLQKKIAFLVSSQAMKKIKRKSME